MTRDQESDNDDDNVSGKALCFLSKNDLAERCSGAGDVIHNILQMLLREASSYTPSSPLTPRAPGLMTPTSPSPFGNHWPLLNSSASETFPNLSHLISQTNSVTLSPAPSIDSTSGTSPKGEGAQGGQGAMPPLYLPPHLQIPQNLTPGNYLNAGSSCSISVPSRAPFSRTLLRNKTLCLNLHSFSKRLPLLKILSETILCSNVKFPPNPAVNQTDTLVKDLSESI